VSCYRISFVIVIVVVVVVVLDVGLVLVLVVVLVAIVDDSYLIGLLDAGSLVDIIKSTGGVGKLHSVRNRGILDQSCHPLRVYTQNGKLEALPKLGLCLGQTMAVAIFTGKCCFLFVAVFA
jgi:hypothetical protein